MGSNPPYNIIFHGITSQNSLTAIYTYNTVNVVVDSCYFEDDAEVLVGTGACTTFNVINSHFSNCGVNSGAGFIYQLDNSSTGSIVGCDTIGALDYFVKNIGGNWGVFTENNINTTAPGNADLNVSIAVNGSTIQIRYAFQVDINSTSAVATINSMHTYGSRVSFVNNQGGPSATFVGTGNVSVGSHTTLTLGNLDTALLELSEITGKWNVIGTTGTFS